MYVGSTHDYMLFLTNQGRVYRLQGSQVPEGSRTAKGSHIVNLLQLQEGESVTLMLQQKADVCLLYTSCTPCAPQSCAPGSA